MFKFPYETTPCSSYNLADIRKALQHAMVEGTLAPATTLKGNPVEGLLAVPPMVKSVAGFNHPLSFDHFGKTELAIDTRPFVSQKTTGEMRIANPTEYQFLVVRGALTAAWAAGDNAELAQLGDLPTRVFSRLLSEGIVRRLNLNPGDQMKLAALAGYWHLCSYIPEDNLEHDMLIKMASKVARATQISVERVLEVLEGLGDGTNFPVIRDVKMFCDSAFRAVESTRLEHLNTGLLYAIVGGCWFGAAAREIVAVALEYPPTFLAMLYMALTDRSYHSAFFTKLVQNCDRNGMGDDFKKRLIHFLGQ